MNKLSSCERNISINLNVLLNIIIPTCQSKAYKQHYLAAPSPAEADDAMSAITGEAQERVHRRNLMTTMLCPFYLNPLPICSLSESQFTFRNGLVHDFCRFSF